MYSTCLHCQKPLGANAAIEHLPIGRRVAFDGHKGRLWVVCGRCGRWNLVPFEDRWEALEECEKAYRGATQRASTGQIALARLTEGLDLVRIGEPLRPEFAAWRYSAVLEARRRQFIRAAVLGGAALLAFTGGMMYLSLGAGIGGAGLFYNAPGLVQDFWMRRKKVLTVRGPDGRSQGLTRMNLLGAELLAPEGGFPGLRIPLRRKRELILPGEMARHALPGVLATVNQEGAGQKELAKAVGLLETTGGAEGFLAGADRLIPPWKKQAGSRELLALRGQDRLALEMALHEETERRALEGELELLLDAWREAEELAGISDQLTIPAPVSERLDELKRG